MKSYEALKKAIGIRAAAFAKRLGPSNPSKWTIYKWMEPSEEDTDSGSRNPLDLVEQIVEISLIHDTPRKDALAPLYFLAERFNVALLPLPSYQLSLDNLTHELVTTIAEFSDLAKSASDAMTDGAITPREAANIEKEGWEAIEQIARFIFRAKEASR